VMCHGPKTLVSLYRCHGCFPGNTMENNTQCRDRDGH